MKINEQKFYDAIKEIFIGAKIEGQGGFINLIQIKRQYYNKVLKMFQNEVNNNKDIKGDFKEEFFDKLYSFFDKYFSDSGSVYYTRTNPWSKVYEQVYTDNKDVVLFWKTHMLYYVKSDILFSKMDIFVEEEKDKSDSKHLRFDVTELSNKKSNTKNELVYEFEKFEPDNKSGIYTFKVSYKKGRKSTNFEKINKEIKAVGVPLLTEEVFNKGIRMFEKQNTIDYFINKNAREFLSEQLDLYLHQLLLDEENIFDEKRLNQFKIIKEYTLKLIDFISQFEDELVLIWNKPKFVLNSNYVITLDKLDKKTQDIIKKHKGIKTQIEEWKSLGFITDDFDLEKPKKKYQTLPIDTKHFKDIEIEILSQFDNLDDALDGRLIKSENYQALNTLKNRHKKDIQAIYIDPPFNTGKDFLYVDNYQDSTWLTLMNDRMKKSFELLADDGAFWLHLDHNANIFGKELIKNDFDDITEIIFDTNATKDEEADLFGYKSFGANFQLKHQTIYYSRSKDNYKYNKLWKPNRNTTQLDIGWLDLTARPKVDKPKKIKDYDYHINVWEKGNLVEKNIDVKDEKIYPVGDIWNDIFSFTQSEMRVSESLSFTSSQKPENLLRRIIETSTDQRDVVLDYFLGIGTTTATAHKLNRKWIGIEMGEHIDEWYLDDENKKMGVLGRMKWVVFGDQKVTILNRRPHLSKDINWQGGGFFKYYELEQYEDTLRKMKYKDNTPSDIFNLEKPYSGYIFLSDDKLLENIIKDDDIINMNFDNLYKNIDFPETLSHRYGKPIIKIDKDFVELAEVGKVKYNYNNMNEEERLKFLKILKPYIWWGV